MRPLRCATLSTCPLSHSNRIPRLAVVLAAGALVVLWVFAAMPGGAPAAPARAVPAQRPGHGDVGVDDAQGDAVRQFLSEASDRVRRTAVDGGATLTGRCTQAVADVDTELQRKRRELGEVQLSV